MMSLDGNIKTLLKNTVSWEQYTSEDRYGDAGYAAPVTLSCWVEEHSLSGGIVARRGSETTVYDLRIELYFDANDANAKLIGERDRIALPSTEPGGSLKAHVRRANTLYGPDSSPWLINVEL